MVPLAVAVLAVVWVVIVIVAVVCSERYLRRYKQHAFFDPWKYSKREKQELESEGKPVPKFVYGPGVARIRQLCDNVNKNSDFVILKIYSKKKPKKMGVWRLIILFSCL